MSENLNIVFYLSRLVWMLGLLMILFSTGMSVIAQDLIPYRDGNCWGYACSPDKVVIAPQYDEVGEFRGDVTWAQKNGKYGYINKLNETIIPFKFDKVEYFNWGIAGVTEGDRTYIIDKNGDKAKPIFACEEQ